MSLTVSIPAAGVARQLVGSYQYFYVRTAASPFEVSFDNGNTWSVRYQNDQDKPTGLKSPVLAFRAIGGVAVELTFDVGNSQFTAQNATVTGAVTSTMANNIADNVAVIPLQFVKTNNVGAPVAFSAAALYFRWAFVIAQQDHAGTPNAANIRIGFSGAGNAQPIELAPGDQYEIPMPLGAKVNFQNLYLDVASNGDGVSVIYV